jgi:hypothetical protein
MAIVHGEYVSYVFEAHKNASNKFRGIQFVDVKRTSISEYPIGVTDIQDYHYETKPVFLLPCPFCGAKAEKLIKLVYDTDMWSNTRCTNNECIASFKSVPHKIWDTRYNCGE